MDQLLAGNWQLFESINGHAGQQGLVDKLMIFSANDLIFGFALVLLVWWLALVSWSPLRRWTAALSADERRVGIRTLVMTVLAIGFAIALNLLIEVFIHEPRPFISHPQADHLLIAHAADGSFPSDHTGVAFAIIGMGLLYVALLLRRQVNRTDIAAQTAGDIVAKSIRAGRTRYALMGLLAGIMLVMGLLIGVARIYVGVHYPLDIVGGVFTGTMSAAGATWLGQLLARPLNGALAVAARWRLA